MNRTAFPIGVLLAATIATGAAAAPSFFDVSLGMAPEEVEIALHEKGLDYFEQWSEVSDFMPYPMEIDGKDHDVPPSHLIEMATYTEMDGEYPAADRDTRTRVELYYPNHDVVSGGLYAMTFERAFPESRVSVAELESWIAEKMGTQQPSCSYEDSYRYAFNAEGELVPGETFCEDFATPVFPVHSAELDRGILDAGATMLVAITIEREKESPTHAQAINVRMSNVEAFFNIIDTKKRSLEQAADPLADM
jgi:hypothetical protein